MDIEKFIDDYFSFLKNNLTVNKLKDVHEISLPFFDKNNDALNIYIEKISDNEYLLTDDSYTLNTLIDAGTTISKSRMEALTIICSKLGVDVINNELQIKSKDVELPNKFHALAQAMLRIDDMYLTSQGRVTSYFVEDLISFFDNHDIFYTRDVSFIGRTGITHSYDFLFQRNSRKPERICKALNNGTKNNMMNTLFAWTDIESIRNKETNLIVIINDNNRIEGEVLTGFDKYNVKKILWTEIKNSIDLLN